RQRRSGRGRPCGGQVLRTIAGLKEPQGVAYVDFADSIYVANAGDGSVWVLRDDNLASIGRIELGDDADNVRVDAQGSRVLDRDAHRVLVVFHTPATLMALSSQDGDVAAELETCGDADDVFVDAKRRRVYVSCGEGVIDVFEQREAGYGRLARVPTLSGART